MVVCNTLDYTSSIEFCSALSNGNGDIAGRAALGHQPSMQRTLQCVTIGPCQHVPAHEGMKQPDMWSSYEFAMFWRGPHVTDGSTCANVLVIMSLHVEVAQRSRQRVFPLSCPAENNRFLA